MSRVLSTHVLVTRSTALNPLNPLFVAQTGA
jgi:hypothetical protein